MKKLPTVNTLPNKMQLGTTIKLFSTSQLKKPTKQQQKIKQTMNQLQTNNTQVLKSKEKSCSQEDAKVHSLVLSSHMLKTKKNYLY